MLEGVEDLDFSPLGATFHFWRTSPERNSPARFIITIAYQLAASIPELIRHIEKAIKRNPMILRKALEFQLMKLIVEPFKALVNLEGMPNRLVIVDGLDECINSNQECRVEKQYAEDQEKAQIRILDLIHTLQSHRLPLSFLILSRPEAWIKQHIQSASFEGVVEVVDLYALGDHLNDTEKYIRVELSRIAAHMNGDGTLGRGDDGWPGEDVVQTFVLRTNGHMLFASTVIRHIDNPHGDPRSLLENLLHGCTHHNSDLVHSSPFSSLTELYMQVMRSCPESNRSLMIEVLEDISACAQYFRRNVGIRHAVTILDRFAGRVPGQGFRTIRSLHAVLRLSGIGSPYDKMLRLSPFIHSSFSDFLHDSRLSLEFTIDQKKGIRRILHGCLDYMSKMTLQNETEEDCHRFAVRMWPWLNEEIRVFESPDTRYMELFEKLLSIDLLACSIDAHAAQGSIDDLTLLDFPPTSVYRSGCFNLIVPRSALHIYESKSLIQRAVAHVVSSYEASLVSFLNQTPDFWPNGLDIAIVRFLTAHEHGTVYERNQVVHALRTLNQEQQEHMIALVHDHGTHLEALLRDSIFYYLE
ncbi:hypothetical protein EST38_g4079 [Candolleomyces aberdarensis]|uniref:Nephrocystin 3-like N-terminal domain-containing protein n=1 Tax=Candolleomyces aberdarensis TaxID=2316362 RepID=A0A4Q2DS96_9AGAR|nr:hypothetical protein EST38_g4079 [Candolleomyces aberdarensis]